LPARETADCQLGKHHQIRSQLVARAPDRLKNTLCIGGDGADGEIELGNGEAHEIGVREGGRQSLVCARESRRDVE